MAEYIPTVLFPELQDPAVADLQREYADKDELGFNLRFAEMELDEAADLLNKGEVDVVVAGVAHDTPTVLRTAIHKINKVVNPDAKSTITSFFAMEKAGHDTLFFADCAVHQYPDTETLVTIAEQTCKSVRDLGHEPIVAFLSLSTFGSAGHLEGVQDVQNAFSKFKERNPDVIAYGELQADAALDIEVFKKKAKGKQIDGKPIELVDDKLPNVFIFPNGESGNNSYKFVERLAGYTAVGPMLDGVAKHLHDSSRGATSEALLREAVLGVQLWRARQQDEQAELKQAA